MDIHDYDLFEQCVVDIFSEAGYLVHRNVKVPNIPCTIDFVAEAEGITHYVEVKYLSKLIEPPRKSTIYRRLWDQLLYW